MRRPLLLLFVMLTTGLFAQHGIRLQNSYFLSGQPLFGVGYEYGQDSKWTMGAHLEFGRYAHQQQDMLNAHWESYSMQGIALIPEIRFYPFLKEEDQYPRGIFLSGFGHFRSLKEYSKESLGSDASLRRGQSFGGGFATGYRTACGDTPLSVEILIGYGVATASWNAPDLAGDVRRRASSYDSSTSIYRIELGVGYSF